MLTFLKLSAGFRHNFLGFSGLIWAQGRIVTFSETVAKSYMGLEQNANIPKTVGRIPS
jgi:hypothetical protein